MVDLQGWAGRILYETKNGDKERDNILFWQV
jgi:hypothetical protein